jgi:hypothetical protein
MGALALTGVTPAVIAAAARSLLFVERIGEVVALGVRKRSVSRTPPIRAVDDAAQRLVFGKQEALIVWRCLLQMG